MRSPQSAIAERERHYSRDYWLILYTEKDTNRAYSTLKHPRILLPQCTLVISFMKTGRLPS